MGALGKMIVAETFSSDRHLKNTLELYDELLAKPKSVAAHNRTEWLTGQ